MHAGGGAPRPPGLEVREVRARGVRRVADEECGHQAPVRVGAGADVGQPLERRRRAARAPAARRSPRPRSAAGRCSSTTSPPSSEDRPRRVRTLEITSFINRSPGMGSRTRVRVRCWRTLGCQRFGPSDVSDPANGCHHRSGEWPDNPGRRPPRQARDRPRVIRPSFYRSRSVGQRSYQG